MTAGHTTERSAPIAAASIAPETRHWLGLASSLNRLFPDERHPAGYVRGDIGKARFWELIYGRPEPFGARSPPLIGGVGQRLSTTPVLRRVT